MKPILRTHHPMSTTWAMSRRWGMYCGSWRVGFGYFSETTSMADSVSRDFSLHHYSSENRIQNPCSVLVRSHFVVQNNWAETW